MNLLNFAFKISRFKFWIYLAGPYVVGYALGMEDWSAFLAPTFALFLAYFFFPANLLLYGVNDYCDHDTDLENPKKMEKEHLLRRKEKRTLLALLTGTAVLSLVLIALSRTYVEMAILGVFLLLSYAYSARPFRFKARPMLDFASNALYVLPGVLGYYQASGTLPLYLIVVGGLLHTSAMHLFSAIPDIEYDRAAGIKTTAVVLERKTSLLLVSAFWTGLALLAIYLTGYHPLAFVVIVYPILPLLALIKGEIDINKLYWYLPYINTGLGGGLFTFLAITKMGF